MISTGNGIIGARILYDDYGAATRRVRMLGKAVRHNAPFLLQIGACLSVSLVYPVLWDMTAA